MPHIPDSVVDDAVYLDDRIRLNGVELSVRGIRAGLISEFSTGLKIGKATYDEREHAFWIVLDDFSGGFGHRTLDIREAGGTHWDNTGGVDVRRPRHITLPPLQTDVDADNDPTTVAQSARKAGAALFTNVATPSNIVFGIGNAVFTSLSGGDMVRRALLTDYSQINRFVEFRGSDGDLYVYVCGASGDYYRSANGVAWTAAADIPSSGIVDIIDMIVWNNQIIAIASNHTVISSADGENWSTDAGEDPIYRFPDGALCRFAGIAMAPWGEPVPYVITEGLLYVLDVQNKTAYPIQDVGDSRFITHGVVWNGSLWLTDGFKIWQYDPAASSTVRDMGPWGIEGSPPSWADRGDFGAFPTGDDSYRIIEFIPGTGDLFAICRRFFEAGANFPGDEMRILVFNGTGWTWYGPEVSSAVPQAGLMYSPAWAGLAYGRRLIVVSTADANPQDKTVTLHRWSLPVMGEAPTPRWRETFADGPLSFETGWFDGGFREVEGALFRLSLDGYNINRDETVRVEYRLNNDETAEWTDLGTYTMNSQTFWFDKAHRGVAFKTVQFRITLDRGATTTFSPELKALVLVYDKQPHARTAWTIQIDVSKTVELGLHIGEEQATTERVWQFLKSLVNTPQLTVLEVPSLESGGVNVRITDMPGSFSDINPATGGRGVLDLQLIEPIVE